MKRELEALLFATDAPLTVGRLKKIFADVETADLRVAVKELQDEYETAGSAFTVVEFGGGWQIATRPEYSPVVERLLKTRRFTRLSKAGLEVLAIVAYRQPITRLEVDEIRGVNSSGAIATLTERSLVTVVGRSQTVGNPLLYGTTREFLNHLGLRGLGQLPDLPELENVVDDHEQLKAFASQVGRDVTDDDLADYFAAPEEADHEPATDDGIGNGADAGEADAAGTTEEADDDTAAAQDAPGSDASGDEDAERVLRDAGD